MNKYKVLYGAVIGVAFALLTAAGTSRYINGTEIKQGVTLLNTTDAVSAAAVTATSLTATTGVTAVTGTFTGAVGVSGALGVTGAITTASTLGVTGAVAITGATTHVGAVTFTAPSLVGVSAAFAAGGTSKTDATALTKEYSTITGTALQGVSLLTAAVGLHQVVYNDSAVTLIVYPLDAGNDTLAVDDLAALSADVGYAVGPLGTLDCTAYTTTAWHCLYKMGARSTIAGAGTNQSTGTAMASATMGTFVAVTAADATVAVTLPTGGSATTYIPGCVSVQSTVNTNTAYLKVYGHNSDDDTINGAGADAVFTMGAGATVKFCTIDGVAWLTR